MICNESSLKKIAWLLPLTAGLCWGLLAFFFHYLSAVGFDPLQATVCRLFLASLILGGIILNKDPSLFCFQLKTCWCFALTGVGGLLLANYFYFTAIFYITIPVAAVLLYSAPGYVMVLSVFLFKEKLCKRGIIALILIFTGCICVCGIFSGSQDVTGKGLVYGIISGVFYSCFGIGSKYASHYHYSTYTTSFYTFVFGFCGALPFSHPDEILQYLSPRIFFLLVAFALVCAVIPYFLYNLSLNYLRAGDAAILATSEPVVASLVGIIVFSQGFDPFVIFGIVFVVLGITVLNTNSSNLLK